MSKFRHFVEILLVGSEAVETVNLINHETIPYSFQFLEESCHTEGFGAHLRVEPMSGQIPPKSRLSTAIINSIIYIDSLLLNVIFVLISWGFLDSDRSAL